ncbi:hypothetical protein Droror1_Dr00006803 [Drosera rotundifolia]
MTSQLYAEHRTFLQQLLLIPIIVIPAFGSIALVYSYILTFDSLRCMGHCNIEVVPHQIFDALPFLRYLVYTPTYHAIHHEDKDSNFCLFMPLFDFLGNTLNPKSWDLHRQIRLCAVSLAAGTVPDFVFLVHMVDISSAAHGPVVFRSFASLPSGFGL